MNIVNTPIVGLKILEPKVFQDLRGRFVKIFNYVFFKKHKIEIEIEILIFSLLIISMINQRLAS